MANLSSPLESLALSIKKVQHRHHRTLDAQLAPLGITLVQWNALREIARNPGSSQHQLAELTFNSDQAFGTLLTRLLRLGLVEREPGAGRAMVHRLTETGETLLYQGREQVLDVFTQSFSPLTEGERAVLSYLLHKLINNERSTEAP